MAVRNTDNVGVKKCFVCPLCSLCVTCFSSVKTNQQHKMITIMNIKKSNFLTWTGIYGTKQLPSAHAERVAMRSCKEQIAIY